MNTKVKKAFKWTLFTLLSGVILLSTLVFFLQGKIIDKALSELNKNLEVPMSVQKVEFAFWSSFPNISIDLLDVTIPGRYQKTLLLKSDKFNLRFNPFDLLKGDYNLKQINITSGVLNLFVDSLGRENYDIIKGAKEDNDSDFKLELQAVRLKEVDVRYENEITRQDYRSHINLVSLSGALSTKEFEMLTQGNVQVLEAKSSGVSLVKNQLLEFDLKLSVDKHKGETVIPVAIINIGGLPFEIDGNFDRDSLFFHITSKSIKLTDAVEKMALNGAKETLNKFEGKGVLDFDLKIDGGTSVSSPVNINCLFSIENGQIREPLENIKLTNIQLKGHYTKRDLIGEELVLESVSLQSATGPFKGALSIIDFNNPRWSGSAHGIVNLRSANRIFNFSGIEEIKGLLNLSTDFIAIQDAQSKNMVLKKCNGNINFDDVAFKLNEDKRLFQGINGNIKFTKRDLRVDNFGLTVNETDMSFRGTLENVFNYIYNKEDLTINLSLSGEEVYLTDLGSTTKEQKIKQNKYALPDHLKGTLKLNVGKLNYEQHNFEDVKGDLSISGRDINFKFLSLKNAGVRVDGSLRIKEDLPEKFELSTIVHSSGIDIKSAFKEWNNFYQDVLLAENLTGSASLKLQFKAMFDLKDGLDYSSIDSRFFIWINNGTIKNASIMVDIAKSIAESPAKLVLGKKNLALLEERLRQVSFKSLKNEIVIKNSKVSIPKMSVSSSVLDMNVSGSHAFDNQIDYQFDFKFRDLLKNDRDSEFGDVIDDGTGFRMFLKMTGGLEDPVLEWDKAQKKKSNQEYRQEEKKQIKEMLKTEFGVFKKDTSIQEFVPEEKPMEEIKINWEGTKGEDSIPKKDKKETPKKKVSKFKKALEKLKEQQKKEADESEESIGIKGGGK